MEKIKKSFFSIKEIISKLEKYCSYQDRCYLEVENKIKEYTKDLDTQNKILEHLSNRKFLDEERFAKSFVRGKINIKKWGKVKVKNELKIRQISSYNIKNSLKEIDEKLYKKNLQTTFEKKYKTLTGKDFEKKMKIKKYLYSKGYELNLIDDLVNNH